MRDRSMLGPLAGLATGIALALAVGGCGDAKPVAGTWGVSSGLNRTLEHRTGVHADRRRALPARLHRQHVRIRALARSSQALRAQATDARRQDAARRGAEARRAAASSPSSSSLLDSIDAAIRGFGEGLGSIFGGGSSRAPAPDEGSRLDARAKRLEGAADGLRLATLTTEQKIRDEAARSRRHRAHVAAVRSVRATAVTCASEEDRLVVHLTLRNTGRGALIAFVAPTPGAAPAQVESVGLAGGERRAVALPTLLRPGAARCAPRLRDALPR